MKLAELGEFGFIERIRRAVAPGGGVRLGIGDDCSAVSLPPGELLLTTTDLLVEDVHFRRQWTDLRTLGRKSVAVNVSDIAAMGGTPHQLYLGLAVPAGMRVEELEAFVCGFLEAAERYGASLAGGDTSRSPGPLLISVTAAGSVPEGEIVRRGGARPGDAVYVSGCLGDSALALCRLRAGEVPEPALACRHHDPQARTVLGRALAGAGVASAMIDVSDGLLADLGHILEASGVGAEIEEAALPLSDLFRRSMAQKEGLIELALAGGEDYELLFTVPEAHESALPVISREAGIAVTRVGRVTAAAAGLTVRDRAGRVCRPGATGYNHFAKGD